MPKQTELEKKIEELSYLRGAKAMIQRRFRVSLPAVFWPDLTQLEATMARERLMTLELEREGVDTTEIPTFTDTKWETA